MFAHRRGFEFRLIGRGEVKRAPEASELNTAVRSRHSVHSTRLHSSGNDVNIILFTVRICLCSHRSDLENIFGLYIFERNRFWAMKQVPLYEVDYKDNESGEMLQVRFLLNGDFLLKSDDDKKEKNRAKIDLNYEEYVRCPAITRRCVFLFCSFRRCLLSAS